MADIDALVKQLGQLTVVEAGQLAKQLEKEWDLDLDALTSGAGAPAAAPVDAGQTEFNVLLTGYADDKKIAGHIDDIYFGDNQTLELPN